MSKDNIIDKLNKSYGVNSVQKIGKMDNLPIRRDSTGSIEIDHILGGGFPRGRVIEIIGPESSGKTTLTLQGIAEKQKQERKEAEEEKRPVRDIAFIDAEHALDIAWAKVLGVDVDELVLSQPDNAEMGMEIAYNLLCSGEYCMIVIDSVAALRPKKEIDGEMGDQAVGLQAKLMSQFCPKLIGKTDKMDCTILMINQLRDKIGVTFGSSETTPGGNALKFYASMRIDIRSIGQILEKEGGPRIGNKIKVKCIKNKASAPFGVCETRLTYGVGIDRLWEVLRIAVEADIVKKSGSWYAFGDSKLGQGEVAVMDHLRQDEDTFKAIEHLVNIIIEENKNV